MVDLYGGAVTTVLPEGIVDVSNIRQVPDTQEVFIIEDGEKDVSIIFDLLEQVSSSDVKEALRIHIDDILESNDYTMLEERFLKTLNTNIYTCYVNTKNLTTLVSLIRLDKVQTDVVISMNANESDIDVVKDKYYGIFKAACDNYNVRNWDLFG